MQYGQAPLLDRLIDAEPGSSREPVQQRLLNTGQIKTLVVRDLENLLNSRRNITVLPAVLRELPRSVASYGLKDFTALGADNHQVRQAIRQDVEKAIARFEPRLKNAKVVLEPGDRKERNLRFQIAALLIVDPIREPVTFDTYFDASRKKYVVHD